MFTYPVQGDRNGVEMEEVDGCGIYFVFRNFISGNKYLKIVKRLLSSLCKT
jgi:hypothetical protein